MDNTNPNTTVSETALPHPYEWFDTRADMTDAVLRDSTALVNVLTVAARHLGEEVADKSIEDLAWLLYRQLTAMKRLREGEPDLRARLYKARMAAEEIKSINAFARDVNSDNKPKDRRTIEALTARTDRDADKIIELTSA